MNSSSKKDKLIPWYFVAFFIFVFIVNAIMATLATRTYTGTITDHPYEKGIAYNNVIAAEKVQEQLGWKATIELNDSVLHVVLYDENGNELEPQKVTAHFMRPTQAGMDFEAELKGGKANVQFPEKGQWDVRIFATMGEHTYQQAKRVLAK